MENIIFLRGDSIGDAVLASSMLPHIKAKYPEAKITVVCQFHIAELYESSPFVSSIIGFDWMGCYRDEAYRNYIVQQMQTLHADLLLNSVYSRDSVYDLLVPNSGAKERITFSGDLCNVDVVTRDRNNSFYTKVVPSSPGRKLELDRHREFLAGIGIDAPSLQPVVWTTPEDERFADAIFSKDTLDSDKTIALFPCGKAGGRFYEHYDLALSQVLKDYGMNVLALGGSADYGTNQGIIDRLGVPAINLAGGVSLRQVATILKRCRLGVGAETGSAHIACAVGTPNVVVLGGGHYGRFMPYSPLTFPVSLPMECFNCDWRCKYDRVRCVKDIRPETITETVQKVLESPRPC